MTGMCAATPGLQAGVKGHDIKKPPYQEAHSACSGPLALSNGPALWGVELPIRNQEGEIPNALKIVVCRVTQQKYSDFIRKILLFPSMLRSQSMVELSDIDERSCLG